MSIPISLKSTKWLADRMGISVSTIERLRAQQSPHIPRAVVIGTGSVRYDALYVEWWLLQRANVDGLGSFSQWRIENHDKYLF